MSATAAAVRGVSRPPRAGARLRLFCFHHAGGAASAYAGWPQALGPDVDVLPVQLPGRENRIREPRPIGLSAIVRALGDDLDPLLEGPYAFYGHSMGALVGYELARVRAQAGRSTPSALLVGAYPAPDRPPAFLRMGAMGDEELARLMVGIGGMSAALLDYPQWCAAAVALLRDDLTACQFSPLRHPPLPLPIHAFAGTDDPLMPAAEAGGWQRFGGPGGSTHVLPGGHFFLRDSGPRLLGLVADILAADGADGAGGMDGVDGAEGAEGAGGMGGADGLTEPGAGPVPVGAARGSGPAGGPAPTGPKSPTGPTGPKSQTGPNSPTGPGSSRRPPPEATRGGG